MSARTLREAAVALVLIALFLALFPIAAARGDERQAEEISAAVAVPQTVTLAPRRAQALAAVTQRYLRDAGFPVPEVPILFATNLDEWKQHLPRGAAAYAEERGIVVGPDWQHDLAEGWPPMPDEVKLALHEELHFLRAVPGRAYGRWSKLQRMAEEATVDAVADDLVPLVMLKAWKIPRWQWMAAGTIGYPACSAMVRSVSARATGNRSSAAKAARSFRLALVRAPIDSAVEAILRRATPAERAACMSEVP